MEANLFHNDNVAVFDVAGLRAAARDEVVNSSLIRRCAKGDRVATIALHKGSWPYISEFEIAIDQHSLPRFPLRQKFGSEIVGRTFSALAEAVREMRREEGSHAAHWKRDARCLGVYNLEAPLVSSVQELIKKAYTSDHSQFFAVLAGTEIVAEESSSFLTQAKPFTDLFSRKRWVWGIVHTIPHDDGPSHLEIDLDLARAYGSEENLPRIRKMILDVIKLFGCSAVDIEKELAPLSGALVAAE